MTINGLTSTLPTIQFRQSSTFLRITSSPLDITNDDEHIKVFVVTREQCQLKQKLAKTDEEQDWDKYDVPPVMR